MSERNCFTLRQQLFFSFGLVLKLGICLFYLLCPKVDHFPKLEKKPLEPEPLNIVCRAGVFVL